MMAAASITASTGAMSAERTVSVASCIPASPAGAARPVTVIDREDIALSGVTDTYDLLVDRSAYNDFGLRRPLVLGSAHAVFLIDGRRIPDPNSTYVLEFLPISAVERVEILPALSARTPRAAKPSKAASFGAARAGADIMWETAHFKRQSLFVYFDHPLGADAALYFDARVGRGDSAFRYAPSVG